MTSTRRLRWIESEVEGLVEAGVIGADAADRVREHYRGAARTRPAGPLFAVLGGVLVSLGAILLLAHNWEELPRGLRAGISLGWLLSGQALAAFALWRRPHATGWTETGALFGSFSVAGALALISQTYQIPGDLGAFVATWAWLSLPVAYALDARATMALVIALAGVRLFPLVWNDQSPLAFWALLAATAPYLVSLARRTVASPRDGLVAWVAAPTLLLASLLQLSLGSFLGLGCFAFGVAAALYALGARVTGESLPAPYAATPSRVVGAGAIALGGVLLCHSLPWEGLLDDDLDGLRWHALPALGLAAASLGVLGWRGRRWWRHREWARLLTLAAPLAYALAWLVGVATESPSVSAWTLALYVLALGTTTVLSGLAEGSVGRANGGMLLLGAAIALRFVDSEWSFTVRGLVFIALGAAFLAFNLRVRGRPATRARRGGAS